MRITSGSAIFFLIFFPSKIGSAKARRAVCTGNPPPMDAVAVFFFLQTNFGASCVYVSHAVRCTALQNSEFDFFLGAYIFFRSKKIYKLRNDHLCGKDALKRKRI
jgi:hypothetical protein